MAKKAKYKNRKTKGYASGLEYERSKVLKRAQEQGLIYGLELQKRFEIIPKQKGEYRNERKAEYVADFVYYKDGKLIVEDTKSPYTRKLKDYVLKRKLMLKVWGISIRQIEEKDLNDV